MHRGLGKGLEALIPVSRTRHVEVRNDGGVFSLPIDAIVAFKGQPRKQFDSGKLTELADSIKKHGLAQPILVRPGERTGTFEVIAGERRLRAAKEAGLRELPVMVRDVSDMERHELALVENLQREDLNPIEQAEAFRSLMDLYKLTQESVAEMLSLSRSQVANTLRLLTLPPDIRQLVIDGKLPAGQARALAGIEDQHATRHLAARIINEKLTTREIEKLVVDWKRVIDSKTVKKKKRVDPELLAMAQRFERVLGTRVIVQQRGKKGSIHIEFYSLEDLARIADVITNVPSAQPQV